MPGTPGFPERKIIIDKQNKRHICIKQVYHQHQVGQALKQVFLKATIMFEYVTGTGFLFNAIRQLL